MAVVTLSRQVGSFGDEIAAQVASRLGHRLIDRDQFQGLAETRDPDFRAARASSGPRTEPRFFERLFFQNPSFTSLFESITFEVASWGDVVILGRGAQVVLRDMPGVFKARVVAPLEVRVRRVMEEKGVPLEEASDFVSRYDHHRRSLIQSISYQGLTDWYLYDMILNTAHFDLQAGTEILVEAIRQMESQESGNSLSERLKNMAFAKRVEAGLKKRLVTPFHRQIEVAGTPSGTITLTGYVSNEESRTLAEQVASEMEGVV